MLQLWSVHLESYWRKVVAAGRFDIDSLHEQAFGCQFQAAYEWMRQQVALRVEEPSGGWPLWAWPVRPDMRSYRHQPPEGDRLVLLELAVPPEKVLISDFGDWHIALNGWYIPTPEEDADDSFWKSEENERKRNDRATVLQSWERIFMPKPGDRLQACVDAPQLGWVISHRVYLGRRLRIRASLKQ